MISPFPTRVTGFAGTFQSRESREVRIRVGRGRAHLAFTGFGSHNPDRNQDELWLPTFHGLYHVSNQGRIRNRRGRIMRSSPNTAGYLCLTLCKGGKEYNRRIHKLVAEAFIPNPTGRPWVNHLNLDKLDNRVENLEWCTPRENCIHAIANGRGARKLKPEDALEVIELHRRGWPIQRLARAFLLSPKSIRDLVYGRSYGGIALMHRDGSSTGGSDAI